MKSVSSLSSIDEVFNIKYCPLKLYVDSSWRKSQVSVKCHQTNKYVVLLIKEKRSLFIQSQIMILSLA